MRIAKLLVPLLLVSALLAAPSIGQVVNISGNVSDGAGGPLLGGTIYVADNIIVPVGQTLTVQAGAIVKFQFARSFTVDGTLVVQGTAGNPVIFTSDTDDSVGGDTNMNGPSSGSPGYWRGIRLNSPGSLDWLEVRFTGQNGNPALKLPPTPGTTVTSCVFRDYTVAGLDYDNTGTATVSNCSFLNGVKPVIDCPVSELSGFTGNTASGNSDHNSVEVDGGTITGNQLIPLNSVMGGAHLLKDNLTIDVGAVLTIEGGVVLKWPSIARSLTVNGTLLCSGTSGAKVVFTDARDDSFGGDTNNDGPSSGVTGHWRGLVFGPGSDASVLNNVVLRYGGQNGFAAISLNTADIVIENCTIEHFAAVGIDHNRTSGTSLPTIVNTHIADVTIPMDEVALDALPNFSGNTVANCTNTNAIRSNQTTVSSSLSFGGDNCPGGVLVMTGGFTVDAGAALTLTDGLIMKFVSLGSRLVIDGTVDCQGSGGSEIVFTGIEDDAFGGDTNADGPSTETPGSYRGILLNASAGASSLDHVRVRFAGQSAFPGIQITGSSPTLQNCVVEDCTGPGLSLTNGDVSPTVTGCSFDRCTVAVDDVKLPSLATFSANTATGNSLRDCIRVSSSTMSAPLSLTKDCQINGVLEILASLIIDPGTTVSFSEGMVFKMVNLSSSVTVDGTLLCSGTLAEPVVFTSIDDDGFAGDTNKNAAATLPAPGDWRAFFFNSGSDASVLDKVIVSYAGQSSFSALEIGGADITVFECLIANCFAAAIDFSNSPSTPTIERCLLNDNAYSIRGARWSNLTNVRDCQASGNSVYDAPFVESASVVSDVVVDQRSMIAGAFVCSASPSVSSGNSLTFERGCIVKFSTLGRDLTSDAGIINAHGTGLEPVVFTSLADDEYGGDTGNDGPTTGTPGFVRGAFLRNGSLPGLFEHVVIRYCGQGAFPGCEVNSDFVTVNAVRVEHSAADGFRLFKSAAALDNLVAFECAQDGIETFATLDEDIRFATVTGCGTGMTLHVNSTATVQSSIAWGNTTNFVGATAMNLFDSNGETALVGMNGNIDADPLFVDASSGVGNLELQSTSPCMDAGNFALGQLVAGDHHESSRVNDHDLDGIVGADMGAFEYCNWNMTFTGRPVIGESMFFTYNGNQPALTVISVALLDFEYYYQPYGMVLCGSPLTLQFQDIWFVGIPFELPIPNDPFAVGYNIGVQIGSAPYGNLDVGNIANLWRGQIQD